MVLLVSFLQDIIKPPILPKILSDKDNSIKTVQIQYGNDKNRFIIIVSSLSTQYICYQLTKILNNFIFLLLIIMQWKACHI